MLPVLPGAYCQLSLDGTIVLSGYVDGVSGRYDDKTHDYSVVGRSNVGDLIDCSAIIKGGVFNNQTVSQIAKTLCEPFNVPVELLADEGLPLKQHRTEDASVHEVIERACRRRGLLLSSSALGGLIIGEVGSEEISTPLIRGVNIKSGSGRFTQNERFSQYIVKGQTDDGGAGWELAQQIQSKGEALDPGVTRYRPLIIDAEDGETDFSKRAKFEANTRLGRSISMTYVVQGWEHENGLWEINKLVRVIDSYFGVSGWFLISEVTYSLSDKGTETQISIIPKEAFTVEALTESNGTTNSGSGGSNSSTGEWTDVFRENAS
jgi:prophage tail gpP-like protein